MASWGLKGLKQLGRYDSLNHNIYFVADPTPMDVHNNEHACYCIVRPQCLLSESWRSTYTLSVDEPLQVRILIRIHAVLYIKAAPWD